MASANEIFVVGIGASAGGIEALEGLFRSTPAGGGLAYVVVTHLAPGVASALPEIVATFTTMPVARAEDGAAIERDRVYVAGPDATLTVEGGRLRARPVPPEGRHHERNPIDAFLGSLADDAGDRAIAVILSGAGSDGTLGLKAVKERGGLTIAQGTDGSAPRHHGMPSSAIATGLVDLVLSVEDVGKKLVEYVGSFGALSGLVANGAEERADAARRRICALLRDQVGHDFAGYKERTFMRRVQRRMQVLQISDIDAYVELLGREHAEAVLLFRDLLIGVTDFFRDRAAFETLERVVIPRLFDDGQPGDRVRVWVPGCSTGEEAYSIAILLRERMEATGATRQVQVFATDIDDLALETARSGRYPEALLRGIDPDRLRRFFTYEHGTYTLSRQVRDMCIFSSHSVVRDPPFSRIDLVSCRNLLIYLDGEVQSRVLPAFHYALKPGGFLFLGSAETLSHRTELFTPVDKKHRVFQRRDHVDTPLTVAAFLSSGVRPAGGVGGGGTGLVGSGRGATPAALTLRRAVEARMLERHTPAHVVVNREGDVVYYSSRTGKYLEAAPGQPSRQVLAMARRGLRLDLRVALQQAAETRRPVHRERVEVDVESEGRVQVVGLTVEPLPDHEADPLFLVVFEDDGPTLARGETSTARLPSEEDAALERSERELRDTRERLQATIEEYETALEELKAANEELISVNEELQSSNEELETSKEEIQAVNEELSTVNHELGFKVDLLNESNSDLRNLFESTRIAIVFLDRHAVIRSFTPAVSELFSLIPGDRGRPLTDIASHLDVEERLHQDVRSVLAGQGPVERRVIRRDGRAHHLMRVLPYLDSDRAIDGAVLTFVDITNVVASERQQQTLVHELNHRVRNMLAVVTAIATQTLAWTPAPGAFAPAFLGRIEALARAYGLVSRESWGDVPLEEVLKEEFEPHALGDESRLAASGPKVMLRPRAALALGLVLHELATNAVKYGALSVSAGRIEVAWGVEDGKGEGADAGRRLVLRWREVGGPPVGKPKTRGFGSELIERQMCYELGGEVEIDFSRRGLAATLAVPAGEGLFDLAPGG